ncbi:MAG: hypothetical protein NZR01_02605 [Bryobacteraceae bacterium]|nr:hypothetical protein [Bryobacteraceae bacterium]
MGRKDELRARVLKDALGALGYPGFVSLFSEIEAEHGHDPAVVLMAALACDRLEEPVVEALPWLVLRFEHLDWDWLVREACRRGVQNRLGFVVALALRAGASGAVDMARLTRLASVEEELYACRLPKQDSRWPAPPARRGQPAEERSAEAEQWGVSSSLRPQELRFLAGV